MRNRVTVGLIVLALAGCNSGTDEAADVPTPTSGSAEETVVEATGPSGVDGLVLGVEVAETDVATAPPSADHLATLEQLGPPDRFVLRFDDARRETWYYDSSGFEVVFRDGVRLYVESVSPLTVDGLGSTPYEPDRFTDGMSVVDLLAVTGERGYAEQPLTAVDGQLIVVRGLVAGFDETGLRYLETIPVDLD